MLRVCAVPTCHRGACLVEHPPSDRDDHPRLLGDGDEPIRLDDTEGRVIPAQERFEADDLLRLQPDDRLVDEHELSSGEGADEVVLQHQPLDRRGAHLGIVDHPPRLPGGLRAIHGDVGITEQRCRSRLHVTGRDSEAGRHRDGLAAELDR